MLSASEHLYEKHFGLTDCPFSIASNPRFSYNNSLYHEAFAKLRYGIEARKGFVVITGEVGTGKTTLLKAFMQSVESTVHTAFIFNPKLNFSQLVRSILTDLGIVYSSQDRFTLMAQLNDYLIEQLKRDHIVAILIDEAQNLTDEMLEEIRLLSNMETDSSRLIQIVLIGQPELERRLDRPELQQLKRRIALRCRLAPLPSGEMKSSSTQETNHLADLAAAFGAQLLKNRDSVSDMAATKGIYFPQRKTSLATHRENQREISLIPKTSQAGHPDTRFTDFRALEPNDYPASRGEKDTLVIEPSNQS